METTKSDTTGAGTVPPGGAPMVRDTDYDTASPDAEGVRAYMEGRDAASAEEEKPKPVTGNVELHFGDSTFDTTNGREGDERYRELAAVVGGHDVEITDADKETYLTAMLNSEPFMLDIPVFGGKASVRCRDLNAYEYQVVLRAVEDYARDTDMRTPAFLLSMLRQYRMPLQVLEVNGKARNTVKFSYESEGVPAEVLRRDADALVKASLKMQHELPGPLYQTLLRALNVFEAKRGKLEEATVDGTF